MHKIADVHCSNCGLASLCLPIALTYAEMERLDSIIERTPPLKKGQHLFYQGDTFTSIYAVRAGTVKTYTVTNDGEEQITGFYFPGELIGLNGIDTRYYPASAKVLETTTVCEIPYDCLDELAGQLPELRRQLMRTMGREIREEQQMMLLLSKKTAEERVATFLIKLSNRFKQRGYSPCLFRLSMSRNEIGNYLGLAVETVSRIFTRFQKLGIIRVEGKEVNILQPEQLLETSGEGRKEDGLRQKSSA